MDDREQRRGCTCGHDHVVGRERVAVGRDLLAQGGRAQVVAVLQEQSGDVDVDPVIGQRPIGERALREVVGDYVVAEFLGRLDLDRHPAIAHRADPILEA